MPLNATYPDVQVLAFALHHAQRSVQLHGMVPK